MHTAKEILNEILNHTGLKKNSLAKVIGLKRSQNLYDIENEKVKNISAELSERITNIYSELNRDYLQTGVGKLLNEELVSLIMNNEGANDFKLSKKEVITVGKHIKSNLTAEQYSEAYKDWEGLPIFNEPITASFVASYRDSKIHKPSYYLHDPRFKDCDFGAIITGDSMHPEIRHGDIVACKTIEDKTFIVFGDIYYVVASNGLETCKYIQRVKSVASGAERRGKGSAKYSRYDEQDITYDDTQVLLVPYNNSIDPSPILKKMIDRLYKVRGIVRGY
jgi:DNA-binding XRE family transcriptional regulator